MTDTSDAADRFTWHPQYAGKTVREVTNHLQSDLAYDQRSYALALEGAERHEGETLAAVLDYEKRWGIFDFDWATTDATELAARIGAFELERDRRQELFPYADYRRGQAAPVASTGDSDRPWWAFWRR